MQKKQITLADLAKELGISTATVSRALKDYPDISAETKRKVLELAKKLHYRPNSIAAGLRKRESRVIGVIIPEIVNHFFSSVIKGIMEVAYEAGYRVMLCQSDESYEKEVKDAETLLANRIDGLMVSIAHETSDFQHFREFQDAGIPIVFFDKVPLVEFENVSKIVVDDFQGAYNSVQHLISMEKRRIAHFRGPLIAYTSRNRLEGYKKALSDSNIPIDENLIFGCQDISLEEGYNYCRQALALDEPCDAIFAVTDMVAMGAMIAARDAGVVIPDQLAIAGFSNWKISALMEPPLTSVDQPSLEMGRLASNLLLKEIQANKKEIEIKYETHVLKTHLMIRGSSDKNAILTTRQILLH
ncbi:MAG: LacI family DNA-binding transcriptional regulator [Bacteroidetes bacterium]|nr:LacI family DNA-binding transcriptional regulator [Bacteroidota bacterium]